MGLIQANPDRIIVTDQGFMVLNGVLRRLLED